MSASQSGSPEVPTAIWKFVFIGFLGAALGAPLGGLAGFLFAALAVIVSGDASVGIVGIVSIPLALLGLAGGPFLANLLVFRLPNRQSAARLFCSSAVVAVAAWGLVRMVDANRNYLFGSSQMQRADVEFHCQAVELSTGQPIPGVTIHIANRKLTAARLLQAETFVVTTDTEGRAVQPVRNCPYFVTRRLFVARSQAHLDGWSLSGSSPGYRPSSFPSWHAPDLDTTASTIRVKAYVFLERETQQTSQHGRR